MQSEVGLTSLQLHRLNLVFTRTDLNCGMGHDVSGFVPGRTDFHFRSVSGVNILRDRFLSQGRPDA
jgi:hypothetical protein